MVSGHVFRPLRAFCYAQWREQGECLPLSNGSDFESGFCYRHIGSFGSHFLGKQFVVRQHFVTLTKPQLMTSSSRRRHSCRHLPFNRPRPGFRRTGFRAVRERACHSGLAPRPMGLRPVIKCLPWPQLSAPCATLRNIREMAWKIHCTVKDPRALTASPIDSKENDMLSLWIPRSSSKS